MAPKNTGPLLSAGFLKHLGVEAKDSEGRNRRTGVQNRKEQCKEARSKTQPQRQPARPQQHRPVQIKQRGPQPQHAAKSAGTPTNGLPKGKSAPMRVVNPELEDDSLDSDDFDDDIDMPSDGEDLDEDDEDDEDDDDDDDMEDEDGFDDDDDEDEDEDEEEDGDIPAAPAPKLTGRMRERLDQDDAEIAELERKLGMKGRKNLPQSFKDDGLGEILESLGGGDGGSEKTAKKSKRKAEADEWLQAKRQKALGLEQKQKQAQQEGADDDSEDDDEDVDMDDGSEDDFSGFENSDEEASDFDEASHKKSKKEEPKRQRENPYVAPVSATTPQKYVPPALRRAMAHGTDSESEAVSRVRRQAHHLIARLSDANMLTILGEVEKLYLENPRQYVTDAVTDKLLEQIQVDGALSSNVTVLIAGFATSVYMVKGTDFGAHFIQQNATAFKQHYDNLLKAEAEQAARDPDHLNAWAPTSKIAINLFSLMAELYNFRMIGPNLIYDYIRMLLSSLTETNTELLLRVFETSGTRLRQDDPRSLKDIVSMIQPAVIKAGGEKTLSVRTRHMIERITDIKKSDKKKQRDAESSGFGHAERIRKLLGNLPTSRKLEAAGPLRVSLSDIEQSDKLGKWWLVGASWAGRDAPPANQDGTRTTEEAMSGSKDKDSKVRTTKSKSSRSKEDSDDDVLGSWGNDIADVEELDLLAREQGMNTDARRSIFVALLSAADSKDAHARLMRLRLNKHERREIANVLIRCAGSEQTYNRYYALVARQVCISDYRMVWVFQASMWKLFRRAGEQMFGEVPDSDDEADDNDDLNGNSATGDDATSLRRIVNTAKLYGYLIASGTMSLDSLKCLSLIRLQAKIRMFVEVLLITLFEEVQKAAKAGGSDASTMIKKRFHMSKERDDLRRGLQYFIDKVVRKSTIVEKPQQKSIAKACDRAQKALQEAQE
ncbi:nuclear protein [Ophiostoma piceae UAMH 11346]|uniref:Nuclear protein n=1 Tax=Ophiostoma piceae (strain UAMH 11346) TaxID=1262450 RepID=S3CSN6_OPHP1|nr:nuclear protein [Ophiostoma piceae UAMH 11346]